MTLTVTLHLWWLEAYLGVGVLLFVPNYWKVARTTTPRRSTWHRIVRGVRSSKGLDLLLVPLLWPLATWEAWS